MSQILARIYDDAVAITPSDATPQAPNQPFAGLFVAAAGNLAFITPSGNTITCTALPAGTEIHIRVKQVKSTGTTATVAGLIALTAKGN